MVFDSIASKLIFHAWVLESNLFIGVESLLFWNSPWEIASGHYADIHKSLTVIIAARVFPQCTEVLLLCNCGLAGENPNCYLCVCNKQ